MNNTNFYKYAGINQNLNFDKTYPNKKTMDVNANLDNVFPKRLVVINYGSGDEYKVNAEIDLNYEKKITYDSTVWQKQSDGTYIQIADLDSITIEVNTLDLSENQASILVGANREGIGVPVYAGSFLDVQEGSDDNGTFYTLTHEGDFTSYDIPTLNRNELKFRDFKVDLAHVTNSKNLILKASGDIVLNSENYNDEIESEFIISHKLSDVGESYDSNTSFDASNKTIYIDKPGFDEHGHLNKTGSKDFSFSIIGDEDIILSNYANNEITLNHKEATFSTTAIIPTWEEKSLYIPQLTFDEWGHINLNTNNFLQIKFQSDSTYITNENLTYGIKFNHKTYSAGSTLASISADVDTGVFTFKIPNVKRDSGGHISALDALETPIQVDNDVLKIQAVNGKYEIYHREALFDFPEVYFTKNAKLNTHETTEKAYLMIPYLYFDKQGHFINKATSKTTYFVGDNNLNIYINGNDLVFEHYNYDEDLEEDLIDKNVNLTNNQIVELTSYTDEYGDPAYNYYYKCEITVELKENASLIIYFNDTSDGYINLSTATNGIGEHTITIYAPDKSFENEWWISIYNEGEADSYSIVSVVGYDQPVKNIISLPNFSFNNAGHYRKNNNENALNFSLNQFKAFSFDNDNNEWLIELDPEKIINFNYSASQTDFQNELCIEEHVWGVGDVPYNLRTPYYSNGVLPGIKKSSNWKEQIVLDPQYIGSFILGENDTNIIQNILDSTGKAIGTRDPDYPDTFIELSSSDIVINENMPLYEIIKLLTYKIYKLEQEIFNS